LLPRNHSVKSTLPPTPNKLNYPSRTLTGLLSQPPPSYRLAGSGQALFDTLA